MQQVTIAKRYIEPLIEMCDQTSLENLSEILKAVAGAFDNPKFLHMMTSSELNEAAKQQLILDMVAPANSQLVNNFIKLLGEKRRLSLLPVIAEELTREIARSKREFRGRVYSNNVIENSTIDTIAKDLGKKTNSSIALEFVQSDFDGIRVEVDELNIEINFSKNRLNAQLVEHILKAI